MLYSTRQLPRLPAWTDEPWPFELRSTRCWRFSSPFLLDTCRRTDVVVYAAVAGLWGRRSGLEDIVSHTGGSVFEVEAVEDLPSVFLAILQEFRERYVLAYTPRGVTPDGWHTIDVRVKGRKAAVRARPGYQSRIAKDTAGTPRAPVKESP